MTVIPSGAALAADIQNVALKSLSNEDFNEIHSAWLDHLVVRFRGQQLSLEDLIGPPPPGTEYPEGEILPGF